MKRTRKYAPRARQMLLVAVGAVAAWGTHCDYTDYPLKPTFCDEWCRVLLRSNCDQEPENCVRNCERSLAPQECTELEGTLLQCYQAVPASEFVCSGQGFQQIARPEERVCQSERDSLIDCAYPEVKLCLDVCRALESSYADAEPFDSGPAGRVCPSSDIPCDSICWLARGILLNPRPAAGDAARDAADGADVLNDADVLDGSFAQEDSALSDGPSSDGRSPLGELADEFISCAIGKAEGCRSGELTDAGDGSADAGPGRANWSSVLLECARQFGF
jgi:hypothetical protein